MDQEELNKKIRKHNEKVEYNRSTGSWIIDIICCLIFFPSIISIVYRRGKYNKYIDSFK